ncbi:Oxidation resistance 1-like protein [Zostera marina]|uniref:Oxidation resistance 1-like protein n=1 Tax=Zostera marina TaxID=29655 RepID=A0A0K9PK84_ZOSMR|nr:Oxidation resistance 1-like protein [Zostera marina]
MKSWKGKFVNTVSRLMTGSTTQPDIDIVNDLPVDRQDTSFSSKALPSTEQSSVSSYMLSFVHKTSSSLDHAKSNGPMLIQSLIGNLKRKSFSKNDRQVQNDIDSVAETECNESLNVSKENQIVSKKTNDDVAIIEETSTSLCSEALMSSTLMGESVFISSTLFEFLQSSLPNIVKGCRWVLLYSTLKHGMSFRTLLRKSTELPGLCLLVSGDKQGAVFGGLLDGPLKPTAKRKYQGTSQTFLFTTLYGQPRLFRATGANRFYYLCVNDMLAFGGGGKFGLSLDEDMLHGSSGPCDTFGNLCLAHEPEFELKNVELWGFTHISKYQKT